MLDDIFDDVGKGSEREMQLQVCGYLGRPCCKRMQQDAQLDLYIMNLAAG